MTTPQPDLVGRTLGSYRLLRSLGVGGMGAVYLGEHTSIGKKAAVKILHREIAANSDLVQRFFNEARASNQIDHPGIIDVFDYGQDPELGAFLVMDYLAGEPLSERLQRLGRLPPAKVARIAQRASSALAAAHRAGIVHRDLKPDNIFLVPDPDHPEDERVVLLDFGIAKLAEHVRGKGAGGGTQTGMLLGTPLYMSPEQCHGAKSLDHRTDIYALGVVVYQLVCGRPPFVHAGLGRLMSAHMNDTPAAPRSLAPELPAAFEAAVLRALAKEPDARFARIDHLGSALALAVGLTASVGPALPATALAATAAPAPSAVDALGPTMTPQPVNAAQAAPTPVQGASTGPTLPVPATPLPATRMVSTDPQAQATEPKRHSPKALILGLVAVFLASAGVAGWVLVSRLTAATKAQQALRAPERPTMPQTPTKPAKPTSAKTPAERCTADNLGACHDQAKALWKTKDPQKRLAAAKLFGRACGGKHAESCLWLGLAATARVTWCMDPMAPGARRADPRCSRAGIKERVKRAVHHFRRSCELKNGDGCFNLGRFYLRGLGVRRDAQKAKRLQARACKLGAHACRK